MLKANCAGSQVSENGVCVDTCQFGTYNDNGLCVRRCPPGSYYYNLVCYITCPSEARLFTDHACVNACPKGT